MEELDREMGELEAEEEQAVDEKLWDDEDDAEEDKPQKERCGGGMGQMPCL